jgi:hypothetical protein
MRSMDEANRQDYADKRRMDELRHTIEAFLVDPPSRCGPVTQRALAEALDLLGDDSAFVVLIWN